MKSFFRLTFKILKIFFGVAGLLVFGAGLALYIMQAIQYNNTSQITDFIKTITDQFDS